MQLYTFADKAATLDLLLRAYVDTVGRAGDPRFEQELDTLSARLSFTQLIDRMMFVQAAYELGHPDGYQASPYRFVGFGGTGFGCVGATTCLRENVPSTRARHAFVVLLRRALSDAVSVGASYRFYTDDWGIGSHTALADLAWNVSTRAVLALRCRFYLQSAAEFYRPRYDPALPNTYRTRDKELSKLNSHRIAADYVQTIGLGRDDASLAFSLTAALDLYAYADYVGLTDVKAYELTAALTLSL